MAIIDAREIAEAESHEPFTFIAMNGEEYELPNINTVSTRVAERLNTEGSNDALREIASDEAYEAIMDMPTGVGIKVAMAWVEHGGVEGKEVSPSATTRRRGAPSRATSGREASNRTKSR